MYMNTKQREQLIDEIIKWRPVSRILTGRGQNIRGNNVRPKYKDTIGLLREKIGEWLDSLKDDCQ